MEEERTSQPQAPADGDAPFFSDDEEEGEFEFPSVSRDSPRAGTADELFADDGRVRPLCYPVFGRRPGGTPAATPRVRGQLGRLFLEESSSRARNSTCDDDGGDDGLEGAPPESYCLWTPGSSSSSPRPPRKSSSTGSVARWRRISGLVVGRSHSFGKEKFVFFPAPQPNKTNNSKHHDKPEPSPASGVARKAPAAEKVDRGGTFLPYREELVGFFASVNGVSRSHQHPF